KGLARLIIFRDVAGVVVIHLVIVPGHDPGEGRMRELQIGIAFVKRVAVAIIIERDDFRAVVPPLTIGGMAVLVYVIDVMYNQIELFVGHVFVRRIESGLVMLA